MRVLHLSTYQRTGGAAIASYRLHQALQKEGLQSQLGVQKASWSEPRLTQLAAAPAAATQLFRKKLDRATVNLAYQKSRSLFSSQWLSTSLQKLFDNFKPDIVHLHWVADGFLSIEQLGRLPRPVVWTLHDSWALTGGCHVPQTCRGFAHQCGQCPVLGSRRSLDLSRLNFARKLRAWSDHDFQFIAPSRWMRSQVERSSLFAHAHVQVIPNGLDLQVFRPRSQTASRRCLGLPARGLVVLYSATLGTLDPNKGFDLLLAALNRLSRTVEAGVTLMAVGPLPSTPPPLPPNLHVHPIGFVEAELDMSRIYSAADLTIVPSRQECLPQVATESLACGTPVVGFRTSGVIDVIDHRINGYLAEPFVPDDLAEGIAWVSSHVYRDQQLQRAAREKAELKFSDTQMAQAHMAFYEELIG